MRYFAIAGVIAVLAAPVLADDLFDPPWFGAPTSTYQHWSFDQQWTNYNVIAPEVYTNPYGTPNCDATSWEEWIPTWQGRDGVMRIDYYDSVYFDIPNHDLDWPDKFMYVQITWWTGGVSGAIDYVSPTPTEVTLQQSMDLGNGWQWDLWYIHIQPNPSWEWFSLYGGPYGQPGVYVDQVVVDTICIPEPASLLLAVAGLLLRRR
jgi:hypothetical protein